MRRTAAIYMMVAVLGAANAVADLPETAIYVGPFGGATFVLDNWDLNETPDAGIPLKQFVPMVGLRVGATFAYWVNVEASLAALFLTSDLDDDSNIALTYKADVLVNLLPSGDWVPFAGVGFGAYNNLSSGLGSDLDYRIGAGVGLRGLLTRWLVLRVDFAWALTDGFGESKLANNLELLLGVDFIVWQQGKDDDWDKDGILNPDDKCPRLAGHRTGKGCPDRDGDTVLDGKDRCPGQAGPVALAGCPDTDKDGIIDIEDACPRLAGTAKLKGCPDTDGDGITDAKDRCPKRPGPVAFRGCPDTDKDGLADLDDRCPAKAGPKAFKGCPDTDKDGIADVDDRCPSEKGIPELQGCPAEKPMVLDGVTFLYNSDELTPSAKRILDRVAKTMTDHPKMTVRIVGHTSSKGRTRHNDKLSLRRAKSVKAYLSTVKGIAGARMKTLGRGARKPRASNETEEGRAKNRRIEFELLGR